MLEHYQVTVRVLAVYPVSGGFGFVVFEGPDNLIDWGLKSTRHNVSVRGLALMKELISRYAPDVVVTETLSGENSRRGRRVKHLVSRIAKLAPQLEIWVESVSRSYVRNWFAQAGATTKHQIAVTIAKQFPELYYSLPKLRKPWMSEDSRMSIFEAASLALSFYESARTERDS